MDCVDVEELEILERYLLGRLTDTERDEFEQHFFECDSCFSHVQTWFALQDELRQDPPIHVRAGGALLRRMWAWTPAFVALVVILAAGLSWYAIRRGKSAKQAQSSAPAANAQTSRQDQQPSTPVPPLEELARVEPPPYSAVVLRGGEDKSQVNFHNGMQYYLKGEYANAIPGFRAAVQASPQTARFSFYLGACYLLTSHSDSAIKAFQTVITLNDPAYTEAAHFYLAKAYLGIKNLSLGRQELQTTVQLGGSRAAEAREILRQLGN